MLHKCDKCPNKQAISQFLAANSESASMINYSNWCSIEINSEDPVKKQTRITLQNFTKPAHELIDDISHDIWNITEHHYLCDKQKKYYEECKKTLNEDTGLITMDFAENYAFICQNSTQGFYFNNIQASLFTLIMHYKNPLNKKVEVANYTVISDTKIHSAAFVHLFLKNIIAEIQKEFLFIKNLKYFSDGAPTQFKNK